MKQIKDLEILIKSLKDENKSLHIERTSWRDSMMSTKSQTNDCQDLLNQVIVPIISFSFLIRICFSKELKDWNEKLKFYEGI